MGDELLDRLAVLSEQAREEAGRWASATEEPASDNSVEGFEAEDITTLHSAFTVAALPPDETPDQQSDSNPDYYDEDPSYPASEEEAAPVIPERKKRRMATLAKVVGAAVLVFGTQALVVKIIDGVTTNEAVTEEAPAKADIPDTDEPSFDWPKDNPKDLIPGTTTSIAIPEVPDSTTTTTAAPPAARRAPVKAKSAQAAAAASVPPTSSSTTAATSTTSSTSPSAAAATSPTTSAVTPSTTAAPTTTTTSRPSTKGEKAQIAADNLATRIESLRSGETLHWYVRACVSYYWRSSTSQPNQFNDVSPLYINVDGDRFYVTFIRKWSQLRQKYVGIKAAVAGSVRGTGTAYELDDPRNWQPTEPAPPPFSADEYGYSDCNSDRPLFFRYDPQNAYVIGKHTLLDREAVVASSNQIVID